MPRNPALPAWRNMNWLHPFARPYGDTRVDRNIRIGNQHDARARHFRSAHLRFPTTQTKSHKIGLPVTPVPRPVPLSKLGSFRRISQTATCPSVHKSAQRTAPAQKQTAKTPPICHHLKRSPAEICAQICTIPATNLRRPVVFSGKTARPVTTRGLPPTKTDAPSTHIHHNCSFASPFRPSLPGASQLSPKNRRPVTLRHCRQLGSVRKMPSRAIPANRNPQKTTDLSPATLRPPTQGRIPSPCCRMRTP